jgi:exopolysaccharide biosynthesis WecB/TagA/CpsF family protein
MTSHKDRMERMISGAALPAAPDAGSSPVPAGARRPAPAAAPGRPGRARKPVPHVSPLPLPMRDILGVRIWAASGRAARERLYRIIAGRGTAAVAFLNAHGANIAHENPDFRCTLDRFLVLPDGVGVDIASRILHGAPFPENLNGTDFVPALLRAAPESYRVALLGGRSGIAEQAALSLQRIAPQHEYAAIGDGYFDWDDNRVDRRIVAFRPDILLVAFGNPRQEEWIAHRLAPGTVPVAIGVGALFDFLSGAVPRAPRTLRAVRLEWLFRLALEPARMFRRYVIGNPLFLCRVIRARLSGSLRGTAPHDQRRRRASNP